MILIQKESIGYLHPTKYYKQTENTYFRLLRDVNPYEKQRLNPDLLMKAYRVGW